MCPLCMHIHTHKMFIEKKGQYGLSALKPIISLLISKEQTNIVHGFVAVARMRGMHSFVAPLA